ncbi:DNA repair protein RecN [Enterococcus olivae]
MLLELTIENFAIIPRLHLAFYQGMTALTGETGAGKSIIIDAMGLLAGSRSSSDYIRQGAEKCLLEGLFEMPDQPGFSQVLDELGIDHSEDFLIVQRDMAISGKSICRVNGRIVTLANLRRIGMYLVDIQGQNDHQELLQPERHLALLDGFGSEEFKQQLTTFEKKYSVFRQLEKQVRKIQENEQSYVQRIDMLKFQQEEIEQADLQPNEEELLIEERDKLSNFQKIVDALAKSYGVLSSESESNSLDGVSVALTEVQGIAHLDLEFEQISENIQSAYYLLQDAASDISRQLDHLELDEERLEEIMLRLEIIRQLKRKYGESIPAILSYYEEISEELAEATITEGQLEELEQRLEKQSNEIWQLAERLHSHRKELARRLEKEILQELAELYMENTQFEVHFHSEKSLKETGFDQVEFYLTTNPGEPLKPLVKVASGGELSRILLALKTIFSKEQGMTSIVFDEVDTGVSGRVAQAIAEKIAKIAYNSQVLCITHLPQVAAVADYQYFISKEIKHGRTETKVVQLKKEERIDEIARMLSGAEITSLTLEHAKELLVTARKSV